LYLEGDPVIDSSLERLSQIPNLNHVCLSHTRISDKGLPWLSRLRKLEELCICDLPGIVSLYPISCLRTLRKLWLTRTTFRRSEIRLLANLPLLEELCFNETSVSDQDMQAASEISTLKSLWLVKTQISDAGVAHLRALTALERLNLNETHISDAAIEHLIQLKTLVSLNVGNTGLSVAALDRLEAAMPHCRVTRNLF